MSSTEAAESTSLLKKTLVTMGAVVGAGVLFVGTTSLIAVVVVGKALGPAEIPAADAVTQPAPSAQPSPAKTPPKSEVPSSRPREQT